MRILIDSLIGLMVVAVLVCVVVLNQDRKQGEEHVAVVQNALQRLHDQAEYHTALESAKAGHDALLVHMDKQWFGDDVPTNVLLTSDHAWIDLAPPGDLGTHPPDPVATQSRQAGFWYNPTTGVFRARVIPQASEAETLALYNKINGTSLETFEQLPDPTRQPVAHVPGKAPAKQYASMANKTWATPDPEDADKEKSLYDLPKPKGKPAKQKESGESIDTLPQDDSAPADGDAPGPEPETKEAQEQASGRPTLHR